MNHPQSQTRTPAPPLPSATNHYRLTVDGCIVHESTRVVDGLDAFEVAQGLYPKAKVIALDQQEEPGAPWRCVESVRRL